MILNKKRAQNELKTSSKRALKLFTIFIFLMSMVLFNACRKAEEKVHPENHQPQKLQKKQMGVQLKNPYKKTLMDSAYQLVKENNPNLPHLTIRTTHLYVKFMPADSLQMEALSCDTLLSFENYPLDYRYAVGEDPDELAEPAEDEMKIQTPSPQYTCVPVGYTMPANIPYEILAELYIPELDKFITDEEGIKTDYETIVDSLETRAFNMTGNDIDEEDGEIVGKSATKSHRRRFNPQGRVVREDNVVGTVPVHGCKVRARRWFNMQTTLTNSDGNYRITYRFRRPVNYSIDWSRQDFSIRRAAIFGGARYKGPKRKGDWNPHFSRSLNETQLHFAVIFQAAHDYYYNRLVDIRTPPVKRMFRILVISAMKRKESQAGALGDFAAWRWWIGWPDIRIFSPGASTQNTYATTIHELAHASHWAMINRGLRCIDTPVAESWASAVEHFFTNERYVRYGLPSYSHSSLQNNDRNIVRVRNGYTPLVIDLLDNFNQRPFYSGNIDYPNDNVLGFTLRQVEDALAHAPARTLRDWHQELRNRNIVPARDLDELFDFYFGIDYINVCAFCWNCY